MKKKRTIVFIGTAMLAFCAISCSKNSDDSISGSKGQVPDLSTVSLSEINGAQDFIELYNSGTQTISLQGAKIRRLRTNAQGEEDKQTLWEGTTETIGPKEYLTLKFTADLSAGSMKREFSSRKNTYIWLQDASKKTVSSFTRGQKSIGWNQIHMQKCIMVDSIGNDIKETAYSYVYNNGKWGYAMPTPGQANGTIVADVDQRMLPVVLNEIDLQNSKVELFNNSEQTVNIVGYQVRWSHVKKSGEENNKTIWMADSKLEIPAKGYLVITLDMDLSEFVQNNFHLRLRDGGNPDFTGEKYVCDEIKRGKKGQGWNLETLTTAIVGNLVRIPDGTGDWYLSNTATMGATNGTVKGKLAPDVDGY